MSEQSLDDHLERISQPPEEMVEVEKSYLEYLECENAALKRENEKYRLLIIDCPECYRTLKSLYATFTKKDTLLKESE